MNAITMLFVLLLSLATAALAQSPPVVGPTSAPETKSAAVPATSNLPEQLAGRWTFNNWHGAVNVDKTWSIRVLEQSGAGTFRGTITFSAEACTDKDAPMSGTFDGEKMFINVPRLGFCGQATFTLVRKDGRYAGTYTFEKSPGVPGPGSSAYLVIP